MKWPSRGLVIPSLISPWWWMPPATTCRVSNVTTTYNAWPTANMAFYFPIELQHRVLLTAAWWVNGTTLGSNVDIGVYDNEGNRLVSTGSTAQSGTAAPQSVTVSKLLAAGFYYFAMAVNNTTGTFHHGATQFWGFSAGCYQQATAFALPSTATFAQAQLMRIPKFGFARAPRTLI
jgi:hypothetical protein